MYFESKMLKSARHGLVLYIYSLSTIGVDPVRDAVLLKSDCLFLLLY